MVSIRRPNIKKSSSLVTVRNGILVLGVLLTIIMLSKIGGGSLKEDESGIIKTLEEVKKKDQQRKLPDIKIEKVPEHQPVEDNKVPGDGDKQDDGEKAKMPETPGEAQPDKQAQKLPDKQAQKLPDKQAQKLPDEQAQKPPEKLPDTDKQDSKANEVQAADMDSKNRVVLAKHGTGPTELGYVMDLVEERQNAEFRKAAIPQKNMAKVAALIDEEAASLHPCEYLQERRWMQRAACRDKDIQLVVYNSAPFDRTVCGHVVKSGQAIKLDEPCDEPVRVFMTEEDPPVNGKGMPPIIVQSAPDKAPETFNDVKCDIPCKYEANLPGPDLFIAGTPWKIHQTARDPYSNGDAIVERTAFRRNMYYSTTSFQSSVPLSSYSFDKYNFRKSPAIDFDKAAEKATYLLDTDCSSSPIRRQKWFGAVQDLLPTEAYGSCGHNTDLAANETIATPEGRIALYKKNRIALAFEAGNEKDHITNIVWEALASGAVPAILGAPNLQRHLPRNAGIYTSDFNSWDTFAELVKKVAGDKTLWETYQAWRKDEKELQEFEERYSFTRTPPDCRVCRWAYAKKYGLGWDHKKQIVKENAIKRQLCIDDSTRLALKPFRETWEGSSLGEDPSGSETCPAHGTIDGATIQVKDATFRRRMTHHDGVTDMVVTQIKDTEDDLILRLEIPVRNSEGAYFRDTHTLVKSSYNAIVSSATLQDSAAKVTILADWETKIISPREGVVEVYFQASKSETDEVRRIRVIIEDMSALHDKLTEFYPSSFGQMMIQDFVDPLEHYYLGVDSAVKAS